MLVMLRCQPLNFAYLFLQGTLNLRLGMIHKAIDHSGQTFSVAH